MEIFGNPITGYKAAYYMQVIDDLKKVNESNLIEIMPENHASKLVKYVIKDNKIKYNRMQNE